MFFVECQPYVPNPFELVHVAAARARTLHRGAEPRIDSAYLSPANVALQEIAAGAFGQGDIARLLPWGQWAQQEADQMEWVEETKFLGSSKDAAAELHSPSGKLH